MNEAQFWSRVQQSDGCWLWAGPSNSAGYGSSGNELAHRRAYRIAHGDIPLAHVIDHLCRNKMCVRPDHLEAVTQKENLRRAIRNVKTHCPSGHPYDDGNTYRWRNKRMCRACHAGQRDPRFIGSRRDDGELQSR